MLPLPLLNNTYSKPKIEAEQASIFFVVTANVSALLSDVCGGWRLYEVFTET